MADDLDAVMLDFFRRDTAAHLARVSGIPKPFEVQVEETKLEGHQWKDVPDDESYQVKDEVASPGQPTVTSVNPNEGPIDGGTHVNIAGTNFTEDCVVKFGGTIEAVGGTFTNDSQIMAITPPHGSGFVDVTVANVDGDLGLTGTLFGGFEFLLPPTISSLSQNYSSVNGGDFVYVYGSNFRDGATVKFGGAPASVLFINSGELRCYTAPHPAQTVSVNVTNPSGQTVQWNQFFYYGDTSAPTLYVFTLYPLTVNRLVTNTYAFRVDRPNGTPYSGYVGTAVVTADQVNPAAPATLVQINGAPDYQPTPVDFHNGVGSFTVRISGTSPTGHHRLIVTDQRYTTILGVGGLINYQ